MQYNSENRTALGEIAQQQSSTGKSISGYMQQVSQNPPRCECHDCTQARWKQSMQGQIQGAIGGR